MGDIHWFLTFDLDVYFLDRIAKFHLDFETINPFNDGNGRIGLMREGFVLINIKFVDRERHYDYGRDRGAGASKQLS